MTSNNFCKANFITRNIAGEKHTPYGLAVKLDASVILESSSLSRGGRERYSILLVREAFRLIQEGKRVIRTEKSKCRVITDGKDGRDILNIIEEFASLHESIKPEYPFPTGGIGFISFEFAAMCDNIKIPQRTDPLNLPLAEFIFGHVYIIFDHYTDRIYILAVNYGDESDIVLQQSIEETEARINDLNFNYMIEKEYKYPAIIASSKEGNRIFKKSVSTIREEIIKGNLFQCVLSRRLEVATEIPAIEAYRLLRSQNPSPYQFYLDFGSCQLFGSSPEMHVKVKNGRAYLRPIAGTRRRGKDEAEDLALARELLQDEKEIAEHLMLIDLGRNDLGRVCDVGSVEVTEKMFIEKYSRVMHIVSHIEGKVSKDKSAADIIRATFPAGTVSGAPKIQAIETITKLEHFPRSFYAGLVGFFEPGGDLNTCIAIRTALKKGNGMFFQAGAGVVYDSDPQRELEETDHKISALNPDPDQLEWRYSK